MKIDPSRPDIYAVVVNDDLTQLNLLSGLVCKAGLAARSYSSAEAALDSMLGNPLPALIVTDLYMPGIDGWRFCRLLRSPEYAAFNPIPILVVSSTFSGDEPKRIAAELGAAAFICMPVDGEFFVEQVRAIVRGQVTRIAPRALICETDPFLCESLQQAFESQGYRTDAALTAEVAAELFERNAYDIAVIDSRRPGDWGDGLLDRFRARRPGCVCLMTTTDATPQMALDWTRRGAAAYLRKPFTPERLHELCARTRREQALLRTQDLLEERTRELRRSEERYRELVESANSIILRMNQEGEVLFFNRYAETFFGFRQDEILGKNVVGTIVPPIDSDDRDLAAMIRDIAVHPELYQDNENENITKDGRRVWVSWTNRVVANERGEAEILCIGKDSTERKRAEDALKCSRERFALAVAGSNDGIWDWDIASGILYLSPKWKEQIGYQDEELTNVYSTFENLLHPEDKKRVLDYANRYLNGLCDHYSAEFRLRHKDGNYRWILARGAAIRDEVGVARRMAGSHTDITERKLAEKDLHLKSLALDQIKDLVTITDLNGVITYVNQAETETMLRGKDEIVGQRTDVYGENGSRGATQQEILEETLKNGGWRGEVVNYSADGDTHIMDCRTQVIHDLNGVPIALCGIATDITERKRMEEALRESEAKNRAILNAIPDLMFVYNREGVYLDYHTANYDLLAAKPELFLGKRVNEILPDDIANRFYDCLQKAGVTQETQVIEYSLDLQTGIKDFEARLFSIDETRILAIVRDVTERKQSERALRESERKYRLLLESLNEGIWQIDENGCTTFVNRRMAEMLGYTEEEMMGRSMYDFMDEGSAEIAHRNMERRQTGIREQHDFALLRKDGETIYTVMEAAPIFDENNHFRGAIAGVIDITTRKQAEDRNLLLTTILDQSRDFIGIANEDQHALYVNPAGCAMLGLDGLEGVQATRIEDYFMPEDLPFVHETIIPTLMKEGRWVGEFRLRHFKTGEPIDVLYDLFLTKDPHVGNVKYISTIIRDIRESKRAKEALRASEEKHRLLFEYAAEAIFVAQDGKVVYGNAKTEMITGYSIDEIRSRPFSEYIHQDDRELVLERHAKRFIQPEEVNASYEFRIVQLCGDIRWVELHVVVIEWDAKPATLNFATDITERKRAEEALRASEANYRLIFEHAPLGIFRFDKEGVLLDCNENLVAIIGSSREALIGLRTLDLPDRVMANTIQSALQGNLATYEGNYRSYTADKVTPARVLFAPIFTEDGVVDGGLGIVEDVTERKRAEETLLYERNFLRTVIDHIPAFVVVKDEMGRYEIANQALADAYGVSVEAILGKTDDDFSPSEKQVYSFRQDDLEVICSKQKKEIQEEQITFADGSVHWLTTIKVPIIRDDGSCNQVLAVASDITERKKTEEELRRRESQLQKIFEILPVGLWFADKDGLLLRGNPAGVAIWGAEPHVPIPEYGVFKAWRLPSREPIHAEDWALAKTIREGVTIVDELLEIETFDVKKKVILNYTAPIHDDNGAIDGAIVVNLDISDRKELEQQLAQADKMQSVGRLAGGVAHDYNNMLTAILGYGEMAKSKLQPRDPLYKPIQAILTAARHSADITQQLLAFARKQTIQPRDLDLNHLITELLKMLRHLIGEPIDLQWKPGAGLWSIYSDPAQLNQVLVNLVVNSRDAITDYGIIVIETQNIVLDEIYCSHHVGFVPGEYVMLLVSDNGCGMDKQTLENVFEPFFTTKEVGQGTGLGLATVYGVVKQNKGFINVYSEPGEGTTFTIYFPRYQSDCKRKEHTIAEEGLSKGNETILLVEDDAMVLDMTQAMLMELGYAVLAANSPQLVSVAESEKGALRKDGLILTITGSITY